MFALCTIMIRVSFTNSNNTLGMLISLGFASGTKYNLGIITTVVKAYYGAAHQEEQNKLFISKHLS